MTQIQTTFKKNLDKLFLDYFTTRYNKDILEYLFIN